ncbi:MAG: hypothetical protein HKN91_11795 [Acidimicrobiia bacterium]|nr:hypothetical protein [Acidimicrobiia bacterium]
MEDLTLLGPIVRLQIQKEPLIVGVRPERVYRLDPLVSVEAMTLAPDGAVVRTESGWVVDRHHAAHPANSRPNPDRVLSFGFTSHYTAMADHFGEAALGDAGENIIVDTDRTVSLDDMSGGIVIKRPDRTIEVKGAAVAEPCVPFTRFRLGDPAAPLEAVKPHREFLRRGMRGFVMGLTNLDGAVEVELGDEVYLRK